MELMFYKFACQFGEVYVKFCPWQIKKCNWGQNTAS